MSSVVLKGFGDGHSQSPAKEMAQEKLSEAKMRSHLLTCFKKKQLTSFPNERRTAREKYLYFPIQNLIVILVLVYNYLLRITKTVLFYLWTIIHGFINVNRWLTVVLLLCTIITSFSYKDHFRIKVKVSYLSGHYPLTHCVWADTIC